MKKLQSNPRTDPFFAHEALDRAHLLSSIFSDFIADHPYVQANPQLRKRADKLADELGGFYQAVGQFAFADDSTATPEALAKELKISPKTLRAFLRRQFPRDPAVLGSPWQLKPEHIAAARKRWKR